MAEENNGSVKPPYVAYATFKNFIEGLRENGIPGRIDRTVMPGQSGATQTYLINALRFFGLIDEKAAPTELLRRLVQSRDDALKQTLKEIVEEGYAFVFSSSLDLMTATEGQLHELFREKSGLGGDTLRKCHSFFVTLAEEAGIPIGKHLKARGPRPSGTRRRSPNRKRSPDGDAGDVGGNDYNPAPLKAKSMREMLLEKFPPFDPNWPDEIKTKWFAGFEKLMKSADDGE